MASDSFDPSTFLAVLLAFSVVGILLLAVPLAIGRLVRPQKPNPEKREIYECGEPTIGTSRVQFDMRFYVVALLFIVFDVEVALLFPWAVVFGQANTLSSANLPAESRTDAGSRLVGVPTADVTSGISPESARALMRIALLDLLLFFFIVLLGFAYVWKRGDLDWVRSLTAARTARGSPYRV